jgi:hypothetical protein
MGIDKLRVALNQSGGLEIQPKRAGVAARAHERDNVERLRRCVSRPPVAALVPRPRVNLIRYFGSFNFDPRSANLNTEMGVIIHDAKLGELYAKVGFVSPICSALRPRFVRLGSGTSLGSKYGRPQWLAESGFRPDSSFAREMFVTPVTRAGGRSHAAARWRGAATPIKDRLKDMDTGMVTLHANKM